ncbi:FAD-dependent oxidoreductase [Pseudonocardia sp. NPDC049154]|uniref:FAD-dependent oxidoreductase n=1 Tax=Pseudonocardia sp. NPDC049154 TaxID=3155501 RepID=UPI0033CE38D6
MSVRIAVVGSGPSGLYTVAGLLASKVPMSVDVIDRLPTPFGLVRYGVAPDHAKMKIVSKVLSKPFVRDDVRYLGNVEVGRDVSHAELVERYDAVVYACGSEHDRRLGIPGEDLPGVLGAGEFVRWYNGHPDVADVEHTLDVDSAVVVGAGNVALDVARVLSRTAEELRDTDVPTRVWGILRDSAIRDVHVLIRRGPAEAKFTPAELFQLSELADADVEVHDGGAGIPHPESVKDKRTRQNLETFQMLASTPSQGRRRRLHLRFLTSPLEIVGASRVEGVAVERNDVVDGRLVGTGERTVLPTGMVVTAVGFRGSPVEGLPFDDGTGTVPHEAGRVISDGVPLTGVYVAGWLKRGPTGVIGTNRPDGGETAASVLADLADRPRTERDDLLELLATRSVHVTDWAGWLRLEEHEGERGATSGRGRVKVHDLPTMLHYTGGGSRGR